MAPLLLRKYYAGANDICPSPDIIAPCADMYSPGNPAYIGGKMNYKAVFFDMDGTVLDTLADLQDAVNHTLSHFGYPTREPEYIRQILGFGAANLIERALPDGVSKERFEEVFAYYKPYYKEHSMIKTAPFAGIPELLDRLAAAGKKTAIISNKPDPTVQVLREKFFPEVYCLGEKPGVPIKPNPAMLLATAAHFDVAPEEVIYVGDTEFDIEGSRAAGMGLIVITHGFRDRAQLEPYSPAYMIDRVDELEKLLLS